MMALAPEPPSPSGKTGGFKNSRECDLCDSTMPVKYCSECEFTLCPACAKGHQRIQATKGHSLVEIDIDKSSDSYAKSGESESGPSLCQKHPKNQMELYCKECIILMCSDCRQDHKGHSVQSVDLKTYQNICTQHIKSLLDKTHDLEEHNTLVNGTFACYEEAIQTVRKWEEELVQLVKECSMSLREDLEKATRDWKGVVIDDEQGIIKISEDVEQKLSKLHSIRKVTDVDIFSNELSASQDLLGKVNNFMENVLPTLTFPTIDDLLPNASQVPLVRTGIVDLMTLGEPTNTAIVGPKVAEKSVSGTSLLLPNFDSPEQMCEIEVTDPENYQKDQPNPEGYQGYRINTSYGHGTKLMIYGFCGKDIRFVNLYNKTLERTRSSCVMRNVISTALNEYVAIMHRDMYLLNSKFEVVESGSTDNTCQGIAYLKDHAFVLVEDEEKNGHHFVHIRIVNVEYGKFTVIKGMVIDVAEKIKFLAIDDNKKHAFMCGDENLYKVTLKDGNTQHINTTQWLDSDNCMWSLCVSGYHLLVGDSIGRVHLFNTQLNYDKVVVKIQTPVRDITVKNGCLIVSSQNNKIYLYK